MSSSVSSEGSSEFSSESIATKITSENSSLSISTEPITSATQISTDAQSNTTESASENTVTESSTETSSQSTYNGLTDSTSNSKNSSPYSDSPTPTSNESDSTTPVATEPSHTTPHSPQSSTSSGTSQTVTENTAITQTSTAQSTATHKGSSATVSLFTNTASGTPTTSIVFKCTTPGIFPDPSDCHRYYSCDTNLSASHHKCTTDTGFNYGGKMLCRCQEDSTATVYTSSSDVTLVTESTTQMEFSCTNSGYYADPFDCTHYYYCDSNLSAFPEPCTPIIANLFPNSTICRCQGTSSVSESVATVTTSISMDSTTSTSFTSSTEVTSENTVFECQSTGYYADPFDCTHYYYCDRNLHAFRQICTTIIANIFSNSSICDCQNTTTTSEAPVSNTTATIKPTSSIYSTVTTYTSEYTTNTVFTCQATGYYADPSDCTKYYYCDNSLSSFHEPCTSVIVDLFPESSICRCQDTTLVSEATTTVASIPTGPTSTNESTSVTEITSQSTTNKVFTCNATGYYADPSDCTKYYYCDRNLSPSHQPCTSVIVDLFPNSSICKCEDTTLVSEASTTTASSTAEPTHTNDSTPVTQITSEGTTNNIFVCHDKGYYADPSDCTKYYYCDDSLSPFHEPCTAVIIDLFPNSYICKCQDTTLVTEATTTAASATTEVTSTNVSTTVTEISSEGTTNSNFVCHDPGYYVDPSDCTKYYYCDESLTPFHEPCTSVIVDLFPKSSICKCQGTTLVTEATTTAASTTKEATSTNVSTTVTGISSIGTTNTIFVCHDSGYYADLSDCTKYYYCDMTLSPSLQPCTSVIVDLFPNSSICKCENTTFVPEVTTTTAFSTAEPTTTNDSTPVTEITSEGTTSNVFVCHDAGYYADSSDCTNYYYCDNSLNPFHEPCTSVIVNLFPKSSICKCEDTTFVSKETTTTASSTTELTSTSSSAPVTEIASKTTTNNAFACHDTGYYADPSDCRKYYYCDNSLSPYHQPCTTVIIELFPNSSICRCQDTTFVSEASTTTDSSATERTSTSESSSVTEVISKSTANNSFSCQDTGYYADPFDCTRYYYCDISLNAFHKICTSVIADLFPMTPICKCQTTTFVSAVTTSDVSTKTESSSHLEPTSVTKETSKNAVNNIFTCQAIGYYSDPYDCTKYYYCDNSLRAFHEPCTSVIVNLFPTKSICRCPDKSSVWEITSTGASLMTESPDSYASTSLTEITSKKITSDVFICENSGYYTDPFDCSKYYICDNNLSAHHELCTPDMLNIFPVSSICRCQDTTFISEVATTGLSRKIETVSSHDSTLVTLNTINNVFICQHRGYFADPFDCTWYYYCDNSLSAFHEPCRPVIINLFPMSGICKCESTVLVSTMTSDSASSKLDSISSTSLSAASIISKSTMDTFICLKPGYYADPLDSTYYYYCDNNLIAFRASCSPMIANLFPSTAVCKSQGVTDFSEATTVSKSKSGFTSRAEVTSEKAILSVFSCPGKGFYADALDCTHYYFCDSNLKPYHGACTHVIANLFQERLVCKCDASERTTTGRYTSTVNSYSKTTPEIITYPLFRCPGVGYYSDPSNCTMYYHCDNNQNASHQPCTPMVKYILPRGRICNCESDVPILTTTESIVNVISTAIVKGPRNTDFKCSSVGFYAHPHDCRQYYYCDGNFNKFSELCTLAIANLFPENAICKCP